MEKKVMFDSSVTSSIFSLRDTLTEFLSPVVKSNKTIVVLCIGSDRSTGDSLGPLVGHKLKFLTRENFYIYGNLENPVHAKNLCETIEEIHMKFKNPYIIAIDACLGSIQNIGKVCVEEKPLSPGSAMNKNLPEIGDLSITGIVNISGSLEFMVLQNTRLYTVMQLAETISEGIYHSVLKTIGGKKIEKSKTVLLNN
ncbi:spore protease YyaC [Clostridium sp. HMP27]|uniref:spore protease YyaC n=1 Tax=Clostridium sp. HMP27 TaxID=1487921 RepID=UPI00052B6B54|nr:spore protease YyaC [Clostridium sp. HMP27]KGK86791.1 sporulation protein [Clostridium sp. HMP27]